MRLKNKVAIITGASQSIGKAVALRYAKEGARVVVNHLLQPELAASVVKEIQDGGGEAFAFGADVSIEAEVQEMVKHTVHRFGTVHILVNNAAIDPRKAWFEISVRRMGQRNVCECQVAICVRQSCFPFHA